MDEINIFSLAQVIVRRTEYKMIDFDNRMKLEKDKWKDDLRVTDLTYLIEDLSKHKDVKLLNNKTINEATTEVILGIERIKKEKIIDKKD